jgi:hypothetical protein
MLDVMTEQAVHGCTLLDAWVMAAVQQLVVLLVCASF